MATKKDLRRLRIRRSIRKKVSGSATLPRLSVFRSNTGIYAQLIDDLKGYTIVSASTQDIENEKGNKTDLSKIVGQRLAQKALEKGISNVIFDRGGYLYHGRVKSLAEGAREAGLKF